MQANSEWSIGRLRPGDATIESCHASIRKATFITYGASHMSSVPSAFDHSGLKVYHQSQSAVAVDCSEGDRDSRLTLWFERWRTPIQRWIASRGSLPASDLDDLVQEVFLRLLRYSDDTPIEYPQTYIFRIASNVASEWRERTKRRPTDDESCLADIPVDADDEPENVVANALVRTRVQLAVDRLPQRQRDVLVLHIHEDLTCPQIAERLGLTRRIVRRDLAHAYAQLRIDLDADLSKSLSVQADTQTP